MCICVPPSVRWVIYGAVLVATGGKLSFWILPNLDNDKASFVESFKPFHSAEWAKEKKKTKKKSVVVENEEHESGAEREVEGRPDSGTKLGDGTEDQSGDVQGPRD